MALLLVGHKDDELLRNIELKPELTILLNFHRDSGS